MFLGWLCTVHGIHDVFFRRFCLLLQKLGSAHPNIEEQQLFVAARGPTKKMQLWKSAPNNKQSNCKRHPICLICFHTFPLKTKSKTPNYGSWRISNGKKEIALFWIMLLYAQSSYFLYIFLYNKKQQNLVNLPPTPNHNAKPPSKDSLILTCCTSGSRASPGGSFRRKKNYF